MIDNQNQYFYWRSSFVSDFIQ